MASVRRLFGMLKIAVEPSGAVGLAVVEAKKLPIAGKRVGVLLSGGNLDLGRVLG